jgi:PAS domain S-box-containing protein
MYEQSSHPAVSNETDYFSSVVQSMSDSLVVIDSDNRIAVVNRATCQLLGYTADELVGQNPSILFADGTFRGDGLETLHERGMIQRGEKTLRTKDDREIPVFYSGSVLRNSQNQIQGVVCVMHDATKQKRLEQGLREALRKQQELGQLKSQFVSTVSHEFRTPLAIIQANSELIQHFQDRMDSQQKTESFDVIQKQIKHMTRLLEGALTIEKMQSGAIPYNPVPVDLDQMCLKLVHAARSRLKRDIVYQLQGERCDVVGDEQLIKQIILNLLSNAIKFSAQNSPVEVTISCDETVNLEVRDYGIGIPAADQAKLFEPFFRASNVGVIGGMGLGLAMTRSAVELHGGSIAIFSEKDNGTVVSVRLPVYEFATA